jgi:hypothetical protein
MKEANGWNSKRSLNVASGMVLLCQMDALQRDAYARGENSLINQVRQRRLRIRGRCDLLEQRRLRLAVGVACALRINNLIVSALNDD